MSNKGLSMKIIESRISECPKELDGLYEDLLKKIENNIANSDLAKDKPVIGFHYDTIKSFILIKGLKYLYSRLAELQGLNYLVQDLAKKTHLQLANTCLDYLSIRKIGTMFSEKQIKSLSQFFFLDYTIENWFTHAIKAEKDEHGEEINWPSQDVLDIWVRTFQVQDRDAKDYPKEGISLLYIAAEYGLPRLAESICRSDKQQVATSTKIGPKRQKITEKEKGFRKTNDCRVDITEEQSTVINRKDKEGNIPLHLAALKGHLEIVKILKRRGAEIHTTNAKHCTAFLLAAAHGHIEVVKFLYEHGADLHTPDNNNWNPLISASYNGHIEVAKFLYGNGADADIHTANNNGRTPLYAASCNGHIEVAKFLYGNGADADIHTANNNGRTPLYAASCNGQIEVVKFLYENGADLHTTDNDGWTPLISASYKGHIEVVKFLYEHEADIHTANNNGWTPLHTASYKGHIEVVKFLSGISEVYALDTDNNGRTAFFFAAMRGHNELLRLLYTKYPSSLHIKDNYNATPLFAASRNGRVEIVKFLLNADHTYINSKDCFGRTWICWAKRSRNSQLVDLIYQHADTVGLQIEEDNASAKHALVLYDSTSAWCHVCTLSILNGSDYYKCGICDSGNFCICLECFKFGVKCQSASHTYELSNSKGSVGV
ncbi:hypothetical protein SS1G_07167 [Sclerotinia sclerotiorum 1980 UF-70]|uniref:Uncharacterized protein n=1 Tax=Sclerotinia sclerotiorum (strain ATCC 18683 / 1980 / Ss-1) TaxID=665079 RepID=A7EPB8_SCLS1|nr:hypothetical protein SS1G_07167 [Sclerotinia sclerotiorum 1980 UF-70]EDO04684.1 hypothetical protein SS1G_07167 [Sclerotinia sclerotiorum 1980 UF-70]